MAENAPAPAPEPDAGGKGGEQGTKFSKDGDDSLANGPVKKRCCTDIICIPIFIVHVMAFWFLTFQNMSLGNPFKLISPMDFKGDFCGIDSTGQWQGGAKPDLTKYGKMMWSMNVTSSFDSVAKELVCSSYGKMTVVTGVPNVRAVTAANKITEADFNLYCGVINSYADLANKAAEQAAALKAQADELAQYTDPAKAASLFMGGGGSGGNPGSQIFKQVTKYFVQVCSAGCGLSQAAAQVAGATRNYVYSPAPMTLWGKDKTKRAIDLWTKFSAELSLTNDGKETLKKFTFKAWSEAACPYKNPKYCVPMPGVQFEEIGNFGVCMPTIDSGVLKEAVAQAGNLDAISKLSVTEDAKKGSDTADPWTIEVRAFGHGFRMRPGGCAHAVLTFLR